MCIFPPELAIKVELTRREIKQFVTRSDAYYGITYDGFVFYILRCYSIQPQIEDQNDYHSYLLANCLEGIFVLRQHMVNRIPRNWFLEARIIPGEVTWLAFEKIRDYLEENQALLREVCGPVHKPEDYFLNPESPTNQILPGG